MRVAGCVFGYIPPMHEVVVKVVAMAVSTVMTMFRILLQISFFIALDVCLRVCVFFFFTTDYTDFHGLIYYSTFASKTM